MAIALYISENQYFIGIFRVNGLEMLISLIYKSLTKMHAVFRAFRAIYNFVLHMLNFLVDTSVKTLQKNEKKNYVPGMLLYAQWCCYPSRSPTAEGYCQP